MEEKRVVRFRILDQPMHGTKDIRFCWLAHWVLLVISQDDHVFSRIAKVAVEVCRHVLDIVDTPSKLTPLTEIVDTNEQCFASARAIGILEGVTLRGAVAKALHGLRRWRRGIVVSLDVGIGIDRRKTWGYSAGRT